MLLNSLTIGMVSRLARLNPNLGFLDCSRRNSSRVALQLLQLSKETHIPLSSTSGVSVPLSGPIARDPCSRSEMQQDAANTAWKPGLASHPLRGILSNGALRHRRILAVWNRLVDMSSIDCGISFDKLETWRETQALPQKRMSLKPVRSRIFTCKCLLDFCLGFGRRHGWPQYRG